VGILALLGCAAPFLATHAEAQDSRLSSLVDTRSADFLPSWNTTPDRQISLRPVINDKGMVAFSAQYATESGDKWYQVYAQTDTPGVVTRFNNVTFGSDPLWNQWSYGIDNSNRFLWMDDQTGDRRLATSHPTTPNNPVFYEQFEDYVFERGLGMNNNGLMTYRGEDGVHIYDSVHDELRAVAIPSGSFYYTGVGATAVNDQGEVAFSTLEGGLYLYDWTTDSTSALTPSNGVTGMISGKGVQPALNNNGLIAFFGEDGEANRGLYTMELGDPAGEARLIVDLMSEGRFSLSMNDAGQILFADRELLGGPNYIDHLKLWTGTEVIDLISLGDPFNGSTLTSFDLSSYALNEKGEIVFGYVLADGTHGVAYMVIPEPSVGMIMAVGGGFLFCLLRRRGARVA